MERNSEQRIRVCLDYTERVTLATLSAGTFYVCLSKYFGLDCQNMLVKVVNSVMM